MSQTATDQHTASAAAAGERRGLGPQALGAAGFRKRYGLRYAYLSGAMYQGIASKQLVTAMGQAGLMGFLGTGGRSLEAVEQDISAIRQSLTAGQSYGVNLISQLEQPQAEMRLVEMYLRQGVRVIEASAFMQMTPALVRYRLSGLRQAESGDIVCEHHVIAKLSRPEVAQKFLSPAPSALVQQLLQDNSITAEQAEWSQQVPMCSDICVEADSGGHTDRGIAAVILPPIQGLAAELSAQHGYRQPIHVGLAGGIGVPQSAAAAFMMGADFILTGSINQCTVEAATSDQVKQMLQQINVQDTDYAPAGDMFELGAKVQVMKKGSLFAARANKLHDLYMRHRSWQEIPEITRKQIEEQYFQQPFEQVWSDVQQYHMRQNNQATLDKAHKNPKHQLALVFRKYFGLTTRFALQGDAARTADYQIHTGPALGAFNQWVSGTPLADWQNRHVDQIAQHLMEQTAALMDARYRKLYGAAGLTGEDSA